MLCDVSSVYVTAALRNRDDGDSCYSGTAVHPDYQRHGITQILLQESFRRAKEAGYKYVTVNVGVDPYDSAKRAYEKAGSVPLSLPTVQYYRPL